MIITDGQGRDVAVTQTAEGWLYEGFGLRVELPQRDDARALDQFNACTASPPAAVVQVPEKVTRRQGMAVLIKYGHDTAIEAMLAAQLEAAENSGVAAAILAAKFANNDWKTSQEFHRDWPLIEKVRVVMGWSRQYVDALFIEASSM